MEEDVEMEKMEEMMALVQELTEQNKQAIAKIEQLEEKIEENKPFLKKIGDKVKAIKASAVAKVKEVKDATVAKVEAVSKKVREVTIGAIIAIIPSAVKEEIQKQGNQAEEVKQAEQVAEGNMIILSRNKLKREQEKPKQQETKQEKPKQQETKQEPKQQKQEGKPDSIS